MTLLLEFEVFIRTVSEANNRDHWAKLYRRKKAQKEAVDIAIRALEIFEEVPPLYLPLTIKLTRRSKRLMEEGDNLPCSLKYVRDHIADKLFPGHAPGRADGLEGLKWEYAQEKSKQNSVKVEIYAQN